MAKYKYSRKGLKGLTPFPFLGEVKTRVKEIESHEATIPNSIYNANILANKLHPHVQFVKIAEITDHGDAKSYKFVPNKEKGTSELAYFRSGQYVSMRLYIGDAALTRPYTIASSPKDALGSENNSYTFTIKQTPDGYASKYILENWKVGDEIAISGPLGNFYYQDLRDCKNIIAVAGGSGITPFLSMASAIKDGIEDFNLTILYGSKSEKEILLKEELDEIATKSNGKVKVVHVLSNEEKEGYEHGFITAELIQKYAPAEEYSIFICGPKALYTFEKEQMTSLNLPQRKWRMELSGDYQNVANDDAFPAEQKGKEYKLTVYIRGEKKEIPCNSEESLLRAMEKGGIKAPADCRSGICGWCHSRLISGDVYIPKDADGRRIADKKFGWIHPCSSFALSDIELEIFPTEQ